MLTIITEQVSRTLNPVSNPHHHTTKNEFIVKIQKRSYQIQKGKGAAGRTKGYIIAVDFRDTEGKIQWYIVSYKQLGLTC